MMSSNCQNAINEINADHQRSADTHLIRFRPVGISSIQLYLKDESTHPTGSLGTSGALAVLYVVQWLIKRRHSDY